MTSPNSLPDTSQESGTKNGVLWTREIRIDSPYLHHYRSLPLRELNAVRWWGSSFLGFQRPWVFESSLLAIANKARQIGWSHSTAGSICLWSVFGGEVTAIVSDDLDSAREVLAKVMKHAGALRNLGSEYARTVRSSRDDVVFASGGRVLALSSAGARSFSGNIVLDEFAHHANPEAVWEASAPVATTGKLRMRVISTPHGRNAFYERVQAAKKRGSGWTYYEVPMSAAVASGYQVNLAKCWSLSDNDARKFAQNYECSFLDNVLQYIPYDRIEAVKSSDASLFDRRGPGLYYAGLDIGETSDRTVLTVLRHYQGVSYPVHIESFARTAWDALDACVAWAFREYKLRRLCIDQSGLGTFPAQKMAQLHGDVSPVAYRRNKVEMIKFTSASKEILATHLFSCIGDGTLALPAIDAALPAFERRDRQGALAQGEEHGPKIMINVPSSGDFIGTARLLSQEIAAIQRVVTASANVSFVSPRTSEGHGDAAWSLALALHATDTVHPAVAAMQARMGLNSVLKKTA